MAEREPNFSRMSRKKGNRTNKILNLLIGIVVVLILIVGASFMKKDEPEQAEEQQTENSQEDSTEPVVEESDEQENDVEEPQEDDEQPADEEDEAEEPAEESITTIPSTEPHVAETIIDENWEPIGTQQTGAHVSLYDGESVDWYEKKKAIAYATGMSEDQMIFWRIQNGGSPQKSVGIVSSLDKSDKYRVYLEWVDGEGWKPVKMDILNTLEFNY